MDPREISPHARRRTRRHAIGRLVMTMMEAVVMVMEVMTAAANGTPAKRGSGMIRTRVRSLKSLGHGAGVKGGNARVHVKLVTDQRHNDVVDFL